MRNARTWIAALAVWSLAIPGALGQEGESEALRIARAYMAAYSTTDWDAMEGFMGDDFVLVDRTNPDPDFVGEYRRDAALTMLRAFDQRFGVIELGFDFPTAFESNGVVIFIGQVNSLVAPPNDPGAYRWRTEQVSAVTVRDGKVQRHEDFANYPAAVTTRVTRPAE